MRRDMTLIRELLLFLEEKSGPEGIAPERIVLDGRTKQDIGYHLALMYQAGFIAAEIHRSSTTPDRIVVVHLVFEMTWDGCDFLDSIRPATVWAKVNSVVKVLGGIAATTMKQIGMEVARREGLALIDGCPS